MKKTFSLVMLIVGTVIGAGFASGREIVTYFGEMPSPLIALIVSFFIFVMCFVFLLVGARSKYATASEVNEAVAGRVGGSLISIAVLLNCAVSFSAMLAGTDSLFIGALGVKMPFSVIVGLLSAGVVTVGLKGLRRVNLILVPVLIAVIAVVTLQSIEKPHLTSLCADAISDGFTYSAMNVLLAAGVLTTVRGITTKQAFFVSLFTALTVGVTVLAFCYALSSSDAGIADMPLTVMAKSLGAPVYYCAVFAIAAGIFTTMLTAHQTLTDWTCQFIKNRLLASVISLGGCYLLSLLGFKGLVDLLYPVFGIIGALYFLVASVWLFNKSITAECLFQKSNRIVHKRCKHAKHNC